MWNLWRRELRILFRRCLAESRRRARLLGRLPTSVPARGRRWRASCMRSRCWGFCSWLRRWPATFRSRSGSRAVRGGLQHGRVERDWRNSSTRLHRNLGLACHLWAHGVCRPYGGRGRGNELAALLYIRKVADTTTVSPVTDEYIRDGMPHVLQGRIVPPYVTLSAHSRAVPLRDHGEAGGGDGEY
jgi:hypothetical protein